MHANYRKLLWLLPCVALFTSVDVMAQSKKKHGWLFGKKTPAVAADTTTKKKPDTKGMKPYKEVITADAVTVDGLFKVHRVKTEYYFEIPLKLAGRQILVVNKLSKVPEQLNDAGVNKGMNYANMVITFERDTLLNKIFLRKQNPFLEVPANNAIAQSVADNFIPSLIDQLKIEAYNKDTTAFVVNVSKLFDGSNNSINNVFESLGLPGSPIKDLSRIRGIKSFQDNVVAKSELTAKITGVEVSIETTTNLVLLSEQPMKPRFADRRVGLFTTPRWYFSDAQHKLEQRELITRWRLEPKPEDMQRYMNGELVEPKKQIIYYIDASTPAQWRPYIKAGIEDWQKAFEAAGFKNAIIAKDAPTDDPDFDADDARYSVVTYAASAKANAMGPSVLDPRSGEILEADIIWWHNVMSTLHSWIRIQTGAIDPRARGNHFSDSLMGHAIRFVSSHEVGHTLGLQHNMGSSYAFDVDSLRSPEFTSRMGGTAPSIMDYARFNYVAQPGDNVTQITPAIGVYDKFAIGWAYRYTGKNPHEELPELNKQLRAHENDPLYAFGEQQDIRDAIDPRAQIEDLGNDAVKASRYGLQNLKRIVPQILNWTREEGHTYDEAGKMLNSAIGQWNQYGYHVMANVGGIYVTPTVFGQKQNSYVHVPKKKQQDAVKYLLEEVFNTPAWLFKNEIYAKSYPIKESPVGNMEYGALVYAKGLQSYFFYDLLRDERLSRMMENEAANGADAYTVSDLMRDMHNGIFAKTIKGQPLDIFERNSQKGFVDALIVSVDKSAARPDAKKLQDEFAAPVSSNFCSFALQPQPQSTERASRNLNYFSIHRVSDAVSAKRGEMIRLLQLLNSRKNSSDRATADHYNDLIIRIQQALNNK
ncbi:zinc-dependent metalloprotease [Chitinophaga qingshengii]|uniref:Zinc-dependent metalloprotease n=1 Tax=Chitinophaga qingshengii TaxID=1569794 RepID=A0ABR7TWK7_9BACT|nr:zinc-dependent metalloprotease [Chitinophaga qingshengii]MBC9934866.1 zinc-dependent metalloprotease [Chitinophaga qingshengii]